MITAKQAKERTVEAIERENAKLKAKVLNACEEISKLIEQATDKQHYELTTTIDVSLKNGIVQELKENGYHVENAGTAVNAIKIIWA